MTIKPINKEKQELVTIRKKICKIGSLGLVVACGSTKEWSVNYHLKQTKIIHEHLLLK